MIITGNEGDVYQVRDNDKEYAYNGTEWVELGFNINLDDYVNNNTNIAKTITGSQYITVTPDGNGNYTISLNLTNIDNVEV